jgi:murein DD-endopeptidase MepM/ murein hydrolase activator NlpD
MRQYIHVEYLRLLRIISVIAFCFRPGVYFAQNSFSYIWPIDSPRVITANYGELRPDHFHAGLDFSTGGKIDLPVFCVEEGYVSRIRVSPFGYGKCVYITHPNGKVSVYAHLNSFSLKIANKAKEHQYITQSFEIDFMPKPRTMYVRKNEIIGLSGNTGGSTGPHLHFEIRDEISEIPLNPLGYFHVNDDTPPDLQAIGFYNLADTCAPKFMKAYKAKQIKRDSLCLDDDHLLSDQSIIGLAFSGFDRFSANGNPNNIFCIRIYMDDSLVYSHSLMNIAFSDSRFINEFSERVAKHTYQKCFLPTVYPSEFYGKVFNKGRIILKDSSFHKIKLVAYDESGNATKLQFYIKAKKFNDYKKFEMQGDALVTCSEDFTGTVNNLQIFIPARTLFYSTPLLIENNMEAGSKLIILPEVNLRQPAIVGFKVPLHFAGKGDKLVLKRSSAVSTPLSRNDSVFFMIKDFGVYRLVCDTIPPKIKIEYSGKKLKDAWLMDAFSFKVTDNVSGIGRYNLWLNNSWVLAEYDAKTDLLTYYFDEDTPMGLLQFKLEVQDKAGNKAYLEYVLKK